MEADWEVEIGQSASFAAPVIDACWGGLVDLRFDPRLSPEIYLQRARRLDEAGQLAELADSLVQLNGLQSPVWTAKCDVWPVPDADVFDADEMNAPPDEATHVWALYVDLLPKSDQLWITPQMAVRWCKVWCERLRAVPLTHCRADLIVRHATIAPDRMNHGITAYLSACGPSPQTANAALSRALTAFASTICPDSTVE